MKPTPKYGAAGTHLRDWLVERFDIAGVEPLADELCRTADRLGEIRAELAKPGLTLMDQCHLIASENRVQAMFARLWRLSGLGDAEPPRRDADDED